MLPLTIGIIGKLNAIIARSLGIFRNTTDSRQTIKKILLKKKMMVMRSVFFFFFFFLHVNLPLMKSIMFGILIVVVVITCYE